MYNKYIMASFDRMFSTGRDGITRVEEGLDPIGWLYQWKQYTDSLKDGLKQTNPSTFGGLETGSASDAGALERAGAGRKIFMNRADYISLLAVQEAYKPSNLRRPFITGNVRYRSELSSERIAVYQWGSGVFTDIFIAIHGTKPSVEDYSQDLGLITGQIADSSFTTVVMNEIERIVAVAKSAGVQNDEIYIAGHSLSGYYSLLASYIFQTEGIGFNPAINPISAYGEQITTISYRGNDYSIAQMYQYSRYKAYIVAGDFLDISAREALPASNVIKVQYARSATLLQKHSVDYMISQSIPTTPIKPISEV